TFPTCTDVIPNCWSIRRSGLLNLSMSRLGSDSVARQTRRRDHPEISTLVIGPQSPCYHAGASPLMTSFTPPPNREKRHAASRRPFRLYDKARACLPQGQSTFSRCLAASRRPRPYLLQNASCTVVRKSSVRVTSALVRSSCCRTG